MWVAQEYPINSERSFITSGGLGTMGFGMGAAIGASLSENRRPVVLFTGDGSFGMDLIELATAVTYKIPLMVIIMNNSSLGMVKQLQKLNFRRTSQSELSRATDFVKLAEAFGARGFRASTPDELNSALESAFALINKKTPTPCVIECLIDKDERVSLYTSGGNQ